MAKQFWLGTLILFLLAGSCSGPPPAKAPAAPAGPVVIKEGVLTYVSGDVSVQVDGSWAPVDVGDKVKEASVVKTGKNSSCDLQFGQLGILHISEKSVVSLKTVGLSDAKKAVDLQLVSGAVTAKVSKLLQDQRFQVQTNTVVCGVRGTRFMVTQNANEKTSVAVAEGTVALVPPTYDPKTLEDSSKTPEQAALVQQVMQKILESSPTVTVGKEVEVTHAEMAKPSEAVSQIVEALAAVNSAPAAPATPAADQTPATGAATPATGPSATSSTSPSLALSAVLTQSLDTYQKAAPADSAPKIKPMSAETQQAMKQTVELKIMETPPEKAPAPVAPPPLQAPKPVSPEAGAQIDIHKVSSITFSWKEAVGATGYEVSLSSMNSGRKAVVKTWNTPGLSVLLDKFDKLLPGTFVWEVLALRDKTGVPLERGPAALVTFQIMTKGQLSAPVLDLSGSSSN